MSSPTTAYGTIGFNDSGGWCGESRAFTKMAFQLEPIGSTPLSGFAVTIYICTTPAAWQTWWNALQGNGSPFPAGARAYNGTSAVNLAVQGFTNAAGYVPGVAPGAWVQVEGPSQQSGTGSTMGNPLTPSTPYLTVSIPAGGGFRAVVTSAVSPAGTFNLAATVVP